MTTMFSDRRAEREIAAAMAEQHRADAAARLVEVQLRKIELDTAREELAQRRTAAADTRKRQQRDAADAVWAKRIARLHTGLVELGQRVLAVVPVLVGGVAMGAPILIGWNGQLQAARTVLHLGRLAWVYPVALEGGAWWLAYLMHRAITSRRPTGRLRSSMWLLAGLAAGMNFWHGTTAYGPIGGAGLALSSLLGIGLWELTAGHLRHTTSDTSAGQARLVVVRWLRFPRLAWAAWSITIAGGADADREMAWRAAWITRFGVGPDASGRDRRLGRTILRARSKVDRQAARQGEFVIVGGVILRLLPSTALAAVPTVVESEKDAPLEVGETSTVQAKLSPPAAALLPKVRAAIAAGELPVTPSARKIHARFRGAMESASEVRDHLEQLAKTRPTGQEAA